eukprot:UN0276
MKLRPDDGTECSTWCSMWRRLAGEQLERALAWGENRPPPGVLEWCSEEWCQATRRRRRFSLQSWHEWFAEAFRAVQVNRGWNPLNDPWMGTLIPPFLAAVAAGCRGSVISAARKALRLQEWKQLDSMVDDVRGDAQSYTLRRARSVEQHELARVLALTGVTTTEWYFLEDLDAWYCFDGSDWFDPFEQFGLKWVPIQYAPCGQ